jgi:hypothetical protein
MYVDMPTDGTLYDLDSFLRGIWLECCFRLSAFSYGREELDMDTKIGQISPGLTLAHEYDFGSTTVCSVTICGAHSREDNDNDEIRIFAKNNPIEHKCCVCGKEATKICSLCMDLHCDECYEDHCKESHKGYNDCWLPVCNSPRMGVCGCTGGCED